jgi:hypothetical protein
LYAARETIRHAAGHVMTHHILKTEPKYHEAARAGFKPFEIRKNDRGYMVGDTVELVEFDGHQVLNTPAVFGIIRYITDYAQKRGMVVFSYERV